MSAKRDHLTSEERSEKNLIIMNKLRSLDVYQKVQLILVYVSFRSEVDTHAFIHHALEDGKRVAVPLTISDGKNLLPCEIFSFGDLQGGNWGILEPKKETQRIVTPEEIDLVVVPGLAFDRDRNRLGYGAGYYDRFLPNLRHDAITLGVGFDMQLVRELPVEPFDVQLKGVLTNSEYISSGEPDE